MSDLDRAIKAMRTVLRPFVPPNDETLARALTAAAPFLTQIPDGWKTIDTAPKDGTRILIWHGNIEIARWADLNVSFATRYGWRDDCSEFREVTHWQPLPLPPPTEKNDG